MRTLRTIVLAGAAAAALWLGPGAADARAQFPVRTLGYFGGFHSWGGSYAFPRFGAYSWGYPFGYYGSGYGYGYGYGYGWPYGYGLSPVPYPFLSYASYPIFSYVTSDQNSPTPKVIEVRRAGRTPAKGHPGGVDAPAEETRSGQSPLGRRTVVYRANIPQQYGSRTRPQPRDEPSLEPLMADRQARQTVVYRGNLPRPYGASTPAPRGRVVVSQAGAD